MRDQEARRAVIDGALELARPGRLAEGDVIQRALSPAEPWRKRPVRVVEITARTEHSRRFYRIRVEGDTDTRSFQISPTDSVLRYVDQGTRVAPRPTRMMRFQHARLGACEVAWVGRYEVVFRALSQPVTDPYERVSRDAWSTVFERELAADEA